MARLYEYQGKQLLKAAGLDIPEGAVAETPDQAREIAARLGRPVVVKAQVWTTGRFKAGGIRFAETPSEAEAAAAALLGHRVKGFLVKKVLVEEQLKLAGEFYAGIIIDPSYRVRAPVLMMTLAGGVEVESVEDERIARLTLDVLRGPAPDDLRALPRRLGAPDALVDPLARALESLWKAFCQNDARSAEINPLVLTTDNRIVAADCRMSIDDASVSRHPELGIRVARESDSPPTALDIAGWAIEENDHRGISFFAQLAADTRGGGFIGYHAIGGGGALLAADTLSRHGLKLANYAETSGNPTAAKVCRTARLVLSQPDLDGYILMGAVIASQDQWNHALGLMKACREMLTDRPGFPVVALIAGNKEREALRILREGLSTLPVRFELFGREYIHRLDDVAERMKALVEEYRAHRQTFGAPIRPVAPTGDVRWPFRTGTIVLRTAACEGCSSLACVKACSLYGGYLFRVRDKRMTLGIPLETVPRQCVECLACEHECHLRGKGALGLELPMDFPAI